MDIYKRRFLYLIIGITLPKVITSYNINLIPQEAYYWSWSNYLDLSYYDHPPLVAYLIKLFTVIGGNKAISVRVPAILSSIGVSYLIFSLSSKMYNTKVGFYSSLLFNLSLIFYAKGILIDPDSPLLLFWMLTIFYIYHAITYNVGYYWYLAGIAGGFGLLSKYTMMIIAFSTLCFLLWDRDARKWIKKKEPYLAVILSIIIFSPVVIWNMRTNWVSFVFQTGERLSHIRINPLYTLGYIGSQIGIISPIIFGCIAYSFIRILKRRDSLKDRRLEFLFCYSLPVFSIFFILSMFYWVKINWPICAYLTAFIFVSAYYFHHMKGRLHLYHIAWKSSVVIIAVCNLIIFSPYPLFSREIMSYDGWDIIGRRVNDIEDAVSRSGKTFVFAYNFKVASEIAFYSRDKYPVYSTNLFGLDARAINFWIQPNDLKGQHAVFVHDNNYDPEYIQHLDRLVKEFFDRVIKEEPLRIYKGGMLIKDITIYRCFSYHGY